MLLTFGDYVITYADAKIKIIDEHMTIFVLKDRHLAESYRKWFWFMFKQL